MSFLKETQAILDYIAEKAGIDRFEFDDEGRAFFTANDLSFLFYALEDEKALVTSIYIGQPDLDDAPFLYNILTGNHLWEFTGGGSLAIDRDTGHLCLNYQLNLPLEEISKIEPVFANLLGAADYWKDILSNAEEKTDPDVNGSDSKNFVRV